MDDMNAFDKQLANVVLQRVGPSEPVNDAAIFTAITTTQSPKWRFQPMFNATKFVVAGAIVALFGGFLLIAQPFERQGGVPGAATGDAATFSPTGSLAQPRAGHSATLLPDGRVLVVGGVDAAYSHYATAEVWDPGTGAFSPTGSLAEGRGNHSATLLPDGRVLVVGGSAWTDGDDYNPSAEVWDPSTGAFSPAGSPDLVWVTSATLLADGRVLVVGRVDTGDGRDDRLRPASTEVWDPATDTFSALDLGVGDDFHDATALADGRVLIIDDKDPDEHGYSGLAVVWDPFTDTVTPAGSPGLTYRESSTLLADGRVLVIDDRGEFAEGCGGGQFPGCISSAGVWDPATSTFDPAGTLPGADRGDFTVTALADGRALIAGGCSGNDNGCEVYFDSAEVWDPDTESFRPAGEMAVPRWDHTATALPGGRVLVVGGWVDNCCGVHESAEVWEPGDA